MHMRNMIRRISIVLVLSLAPIAGLAATPSKASACGFRCVQYYQPFEHKKCDQVDEGPMYANCQLGPSLNQCTQWNPIVFCF
jgi:hypothetical protein